MLARPTVYGSSVTERQAGPGDVIASGEVINTLGTAGAGTITGALIAGGIISRSGPGAGFTDTLDSVQNTLVALAGNDFAANVQPGTTFRLLYINTVAFAMTLAAGTGWTLGSNVNVAASVNREYLVTILNSTPQVALSGGTTNASTALTLDNPVAPGTITPGMAVTGTGIAANTTVAGVVYGDTTNRKNGDKIVGVTLSQNATATNASGILFTFSPTARIDGLRAGTA